MISHPLHQNLDTSFVDLSALLKYLRKRQFVGSVKVQLNGYHAEIRLGTNNQLHVREEDRISGRISTGKEALQRLLIRSREPGGSINVYQLKAASKKPKTVRPHDKTPVSKSQVRTSVSAPSSRPTPEVQRAAVGNGNRKPQIKTNGNGTPAPSKTAARYVIHDELIPIEDPVLKKPVSQTESPLKEKPAQNQTSLPDFPFELSNKVERKARQCKLAEEDWQTLLKLTVELLGVVDRSLQNHGLDFAAAYRKACAEISCDYPFMNPSQNVFDYGKGRVTMNKQVNEAVFVNSITESLGRIVERLGQNPKFGTVYRETNHLIIALINKRNSVYDRFGLTTPLERLVGH